MFGKIAVIIYKNNEGQIERLIYLLTATVDKLIHSVSIALFLKNILAYKKEAAQKRQPLSIFAILLVSSHRKGIKILNSLVAQLSF